MSDQAPIYLTKLQSLRRGIEQGWYVVDGDGNLCVGPFPTPRGLRPTDCAASPMIATRNQRAVLQKPQGLLTHSNRLWPDH
jgi:hypothetical protein